MTPLEAVLELGCRLETEMLEHTDCKFHVPQSIRETNVVRISDDTLLKYGVEAVGGVTTVEASTGVHTRTLNLDGLLLRKKFVLTVHFLNCNNNHLTTESWHILGAS